MKTIRVSWSQLAGQWQVSEYTDNAASPAADQTVSLEQWAESQPELTAVRMVIAAENYSTHWAELPGISSRHLAKALPFALEENLIEDVSHYQIIAAGKVDGRVRAYAVSIDLVERLLEQCEHLHLIPRELIPETQLLPAGASAVWQREGWLLSVPGAFEGWVMPFAVSAVLESALADKQGLGTLRIQSPSRDQSNLLKTTLETGFADAFESIEVTGAEQPLLLLPGQLSKPANFLSGQFQVSQSADKPKAWWRSLAAMAVVAAVLGATGLAVDTHRTSSQALEARAAATDLYKQLFPGERVRMIKSQFRSKLSGAGNDSSGGFTSIINRAAAGVAAANIKNLKIDSIRYNDRQGEIIMEVLAANLADVQTLRQAIADQGLEAEVASASNEKDVVKGRIKIGESA